MPQHQQKSNNGQVSGGDALLKKWTVVASLILSSAAIVKPLIFADNERVKMEEHLTFVDKRLDKGEQEWARKDVLDMRVSNVEKSQAQAETLLREQNKALDLIKDRIEDLRVKK